MATLSNPVNSPTLDGSESSCTTDTAQGTRYAVSQTEAFEGSPEDSAGYIIANSSAVRVDSATLSETFAGQPQGTAYNLGWAQSDAVIAYVRADGTASDKHTAPGGSATNSMNLATLQSQSLDPGDLIYMDGTGGDFTTAFNIQGTWVGTDQDPISFVGINGAKIGVGSGVCAAVFGGAQFITVDGLDLDGATTLAALIVAANAGTATPGGTVKFMNCEIVSRFASYIVQVENGGSLSLENVTLTPGDAAVGVAVALWVGVGSYSHAINCTSVGAGTHVQSAGLTQISGGSFTGSTTKTFYASSSGSEIYCDGATVSGASGNGMPELVTGSKISVYGGSWTASGDGTSNGGGTLEMGNIDTFTIDNSNRINITGAASIKLYNCGFVFTDSTGAPFAQGSTTTKITITRCRFDFRGLTSNATKICEGTGGGGTVEFDCNVAWGLLAWYNPGVVSPGTSGTLYARNNSVYGGRRFFHYNSDTLKGELINNIMHTTDATMDTTLITDIDSNNIFGGAVWGGTNETTTDPLFVNTTDNMRLQSGSPAKDSGADWWNQIADLRFQIDQDEVRMSDCRGAYES